MGQVHVITLQMIATGMIKLVVTDNTELGTEGMSKVNVTIKATVTSIERDGKNTQNTNVHG